MVQRFEAVPYMKGSEVEMVALPYQGGAIRLYLLLPAAGRSVQSLVADLAAGRWNEWLAQLRPAALQVELPRFTIDNQAIGNQHDLQGVLQALGIRAAFDPPGFTKIYENGGNWITIVRQGAKIVVNEEGTEAGAATIVITERAAFKEPVFRANRPFVFLLRHEPTGAILFAGILRQPQE
jgi:serine protease inhibitor